MNHLTSEQISDYVDGALSSDVDLHLRVCPACQSKVKSLQAIDRSLRSLPLEVPAPGFTERVMNGLGITTSPSFAWLFFRNLAPLFALTIVVAIVVVALKIAGIFDTTEIGQTSNATQHVYNQVGGSLSIGLHAFNSWVATYFSFAFAKNTYGLTAFVFVFLGAIALLDKYLIMPKMRKRTM